MQIDGMIFIGIIYICIYVYISTFLSSRKCDYLHQTSLALIVGVVFGVILYEQTNVFNGNINQTTRQLIFLILLPPVLFEDGYNVPKRKFFQNFLYVNLYGLIGTIIQFILMYGIIYLFNSQKLITALSSNKFNTISMTNWQMLLLCSSLSSIQPLVAQKIVNAQRYPKLFSIIFGESILKDTFTVTLFEAICKVVERNQNQIVTIDLEGREIGLIIGVFVEVVVCSIVIGVVGACITTLVFKHCRFLLKSNGVAEITLIIGTGFAVYIASEWAKLSGVISMLFCGIFLSHFNTLNISKRGKEVTQTTVATIKIIAEGLLYLLVGMFIFNLQYTAVNDDSTTQVDNAVSYILFLVTVMVLIIGRIVNIYLMSLIGWLIVGAQNWRLNFIDYAIIFVSGLVKGPVPFALILGIPGLDSPNASVAIASSSIVITVVYIVFLSSLFLNSLTPFLLRNRLEALMIHMKSNPHHPSVKDSFILLENQKASYGGKFKSFTQRWVHKMEEGFIKPFLIYNYYGRRQQIKMEKLKQRELQYKEYMERLGLHLEQENYLDPNGPNKFIDLQPQISDSDEDHHNGSFPAESFHENNTPQHPQTNQKRNSQIEVPLINNSKHNNE